MISGTQGYAEQAAELPKRYESVSFASQRCSVVAVEPTDELCEPGNTFHPSPLIEWPKGGLPNVVSVLTRRHNFLMVLRASRLAFSVNRRRT